MGTTPNTPASVPPINDIDDEIFELDTDFDDLESDDTAVHAVKPNSGKKVRLNKLIADSGIASRRAADKIIEEGQVTVNGKKVYELGIRVDPNNDRIFVAGKPIRKKFDHLYIMFHKPKGILTTMEDPLGRPTIQKFLEEVPARVFPVGRLDWDSEGLLLLTNDGDYANKIAHPTAEVTKTYLVKVDGQPSTEKINKLLSGVPILGGRVAAKSVEKVKRGKDKYDWLKIVITEGKNRQIRQMFEKIGFDVLKLQRVAIGRLRIGNLMRGEMVYLNKIAADRVFQQDIVEEVKVKKTYANRTKQVSQKKMGSTNTNPFAPKPVAAAPQKPKHAFGRPSRKTMQNSLKMTAYKAASKAAKSKSPTV